MTEDDHEQLARDIFVEFVMRYMAGETNPTGRAIEGAEKRGRDALAASDRLPRAISIPGVDPPSNRDCLEYGPERIGGPSRGVLPEWDEGVELLESMGFADVEIALDAPHRDEDAETPLFVRAVLPDGWEKRRSEDHRRLALFDDRGRERATIFYKAVYYDRKAHLRFHRRLDVRSVHDDPERFQRGVYARGLGWVWRSELRDVIEGDGTHDVAGPDGTKVSPFDAWEHIQEAVEGVLDDVLPDWRHGLRLWGSDAEDAIRDAADALDSRIEW